MQPRPRRGRPPAREAAPRGTRVLYARVPAEALERWLRAAERDDRTLASWVRVRLDAAADGELGDG